MKTLPKKGVISSIILSYSKKSHELRYFVKNSVVHKLCCKSFGWVLPFYLSSMRKQFSYAIDLSQKTI